MSERRFWFEEVPEEQKYWFLAPSGKSQRQAREEDERQAERQAELEDFGLTSQDSANLGNIASDVGHASVFGGTEEEAAEIRKEIDEVHERIEAVGFGDQALEPPSWPTVQWWDHQEGWDRVRAPILYTKRKQAEEAKPSLEVEDYQELVEQHGEANADELLDNYIPYRALWVNQETLLDKLEDSTFLCVMVDGVLRLRRDFIKELRSDVKEDT